MEYLYSYRNYACGSRCGCQRCSQKGPVADYLNKPCCKKPQTALEKIMSVKDPLCPNEPDKKEKFEPYEGAPYVGYRGCGNFNPEVVCSGGASCNQLIAQHRPPAPYCAPINRSGLVPYTSTAQYYRCKLGEPGACLPDCPCQLSFAERSQRLQKLEKLEKMKGGDDDNKNGEDDGNGKEKFHPHYNDDPGAFCGCGSYPYPIPEVPCCHNPDFHIYQLQQGPVWIP